MSKYIFGKPINMLLHGGDYNPDQWLDYPDIFKKDIELMKQAGINEATLGVFSWAAYEPKEGEFSFEWLKKVMDELYDNGIYTILATPSGARPVWMDLKYPEVMRVDGMGHRNRHGFRHNHCLSSMVFRDKVRIINSKLAENFSDHPGLLAWHISNEFGGECFCDNCKERFRDFLREKYHNDINELNHAWWTSFWSAKYSDFNEIEPPYTNGQFAINGMNLDWKRFTTWNYSDYISTEIDSIKQASKNKNVPITTNFMSRFYGIDYKVLAKQLDVISWDSYPAFHNDEETYADTMLLAAFDNAIMRSMKKDTPFLLMESAPGLVNWMEYNKVKRPGVHEQFALQTVASGSDSVQYFQIRKSRGSAEQHHGALIDHVGTNETRIFREVSETGEMLRRLHEVEGSIMHNQAAVIFDWENWWAVDGAQAFSRHTKNYDKTCFSYWRKLMEFGVEADVISMEDDFSDYKLLIAPMLYMLKPGVADRLKAFVENGGILLATYITGYVNETCLCNLGGFPGEGLTDLFGIINTEIDTLYPSDRNEIVISDSKYGKTMTVKDYAEILRVIDADIIGTYKDDFYSETPAITVKKHGSGRAYYQAARCDISKMSDFFKCLLDESGIEAKKLPAGTEYHVRYGEEYKYEFYLNISDDIIEIDDISGTDMNSGDEISGNAVLKPKKYIVIRSAI